MIARANHVGVEGVEGAAAQPLELTGARLLDHCLLRVQRSRHTRLD